ncbi:MAG: hypothetical protein EOP51_03645 [Sphingobacteriales bacterium]|nr:MAG: hypothetical protein EOP51_03645 [Sphingobacteriales bacterium]
MVEVFKTNVQEQVHAADLVTLFHRRFPGNRINFDLEDCDRILRIEGDVFCSDTIKALMNEQGFQCAVLE